MDVDSNATFNPVYREKIDGTAVRLLQFSKSQDGGFTGRLKRFELAHAPHFYSASYTWGTKAYSDTAIKLRMGELPVLQGLLPFLHMVSEHGDFHDEDWWWIDSLSINLADGQERESQVRIMADIYKKAKRAMVWLGDEVEGSSDCRGAIDFLHHLQSLQPVFSGQQADAARANLRSLHMASHWTSVSHLLARPWWSRVWTLQEMILPGEVKFYCGKHSISRGRFKTAMYSIFLCSIGDRDMDVELIARKTFDSAFNRRRVHQWHVHPNARGISLVAILAYIGNHSASDARDRVYSVLGLITERDRRLVGIPEYKTSVQHQYAKLVRSFYNEYQSLDVICFSHIFNRYAALEDPGMENAVSSWVPDWRIYTEFASPVPLMASQSASEHIGNFRPLHGQKWKARYDAPGQRLKERANVLFHQNLKEIWCDGVVLGIIDTLGALTGCEPRCRSFICTQDKPSHGILQGSTGLNPEDHTIPNPMALINSITQSLVLGRQDKYLRFVAPKYYVSDFLVICSACLDPGMLPETLNHPTDPTFAAWFNENRGLRLGTWTLEQILQSVVLSKDPSLYESLPPPTLHATSLSHRLTMHPPDPKASAESDFADNFLSRFLDTTRKKSRRLMATSEGHIGMAPCRARPGDAVVVLFGCNIPLVLRRVGTQEAWQVIGEAYVDEFMNGEVERLINGGTRDVYRFRVV